MKEKLVQELVVLIKDAEILTKPFIEGSIEFVFNKSKLDSYTKTVNSFIVSVNKAENIDEFVFSSRTNLSDMLINVLEERKNLTVNNTVEHRGEISGKMSALVDMSAVLAIIDTIIASNKINNQ